MGGDDKLGVLLDKLVDVHKQGHQPIRGEGRFRFIQQVNSVAAKAVFHKGEEALSMGLSVERSLPIAGAYLRSELFFVYLVNIAGSILEALRAQKEAVLRVGAAGKGDISVQL